MVKSKTKKAAFWIKLALAVALAALVVVVALGAAEGVGASAGEQGRALLEDSLYKGAVSCYAVEGRYPPTLDYLTENYAVVVDADRYAVFYEIFADNIMPDITVVSLS